MLTTIPSHGTGINVQMSQVSRNVDCDPGSRHGSEINLDSDSESRAII